MNKYNQNWVLIFAQGNQTKWAITILNTSYFSVGESDVNRNWMNHENEHKRQWKQYWYIGFIFLYIWYLIKYGYYNNPLEVQARKAE